MSEAPEPDQADIVKSLQASRIDIIGKVKTPMGFAVLALLIVEPLIFFFATLAAIPWVWRIVFMFIGIGLFCYVFESVMRFSKNNPINLLFTEQSHLQLLTMKSYGTKEEPVTGLEIKTKRPIAAPASAGELPPATEDKQQ